MLLLERAPLVLTELSREGSLSDRPGGIPLHAPRRATLMLWVVVVALTHFDRGAATVAAMDLAAWDGHTVQLTFGYVVALLAWHSVGLAVGGFFAGVAFQKASSAKAVLVLALLCNAGALLALSLQARADLMLASALRFGSGLAAAFPLAYLPLWVDEFAPSEAGGQWMAVVQLGSPLGQFLGVLIAGSVTAACRSSNGLDWHFALLVQATLIVPVAVRVLLTPSSQVDVANISSLRARLDSLMIYPAEGSQMGHLHGLVRETREMLQGVSRNPLTVSLTVVLCLLHSTGAALSLWVAPYLALSEGAPPPLATLILAALTLASAPAAGTYAGALLCDRLDGFKAGHHATALRVACGFVALAAIAGPASGSAHSFLPRLLLAAFWLVGSGAFLPISAGLLMTSMPSYLRSFSSATSLLAFHLIGFALVPAVSAALMEWFPRPREGLAFGVGFALWATTPAAVLMLVTCVREPKGMQAGGLAGVDDLTFGDIGYELSRRRMSTSPL